MAAPQRTIHRASSSFSTIPGDGDEIIHSSPPLQAHHAVFRAPVHPQQHHRSAPPSHASSPHGPKAIDVDAHWPNAYPRGPPLPGLQHSFHTQQHHGHPGHPGAYMPPVAPSTSHSVMPSGPPAFSPPHVQSFSAGGHMHMPMPMRYPSGHGPPLGVFPASSHSAFDEEEQVSPTLQLSRNQAHTTPATPSSYFGAPLAAGSSEQQHGASTAKATGKKAAGKAKASKAATAAPPDASAAGSPSKKTPRDPKRRATHSQIERRRREKINDRLITLRNLIPACVQEMENRAKALVEEEEDIRRIRAGLMPSTSFPNRRVKRKRLRRKVEATTKAKDADKEGDLGMHKLEVLTHTIDYIYQLHARIEELETGKRPARIRRAEDNEDDLMEDVEGEGASSSRAPRATVKQEQDDEGALPGTSTKAPRRSTKLQADGDEDEEDDEDEGSEADELEDDGDEDEYNHDGDDMDIDLAGPPLKRRNSNMKEATSIATQRRASLGGLSAASETSSEVSVGPAGHSPYHELSPMFPPTRTASSSLSSLTSPFMSLSATSPIFMNGKQSSAQGPVAWSKLTLPPNALSAHEVSEALRAGSSSVESAPGHVSRSKSQHGSISAVRGGTDDGSAAGTSSGDLGMKIATTTGEDRSAAELLLAFSGSPEEALRPVGGKVTTTPRARMARRSTTSSQVISRGQMPAFSTPQVRPAGGSGHGIQRTQATPSPHKDTAKYKVPGSAPGGSMATPTGRETLPSPPPLELDAKER